MISAFNKMCGLPYQQGMRRKMQRNIKRRDDRQRRIARPNFRRIARAICCSVCFAIAPLAFASDAGGVSAGIDEEVTITEGTNRTVFEYRQNGQLRAIKVVPALGKPYYLVPADPSKGNGDLEHSGALVPSWRIVEF